MKGQREGPLILNINRAEMQLTLIAGFSANYFLQGS